MCPRIWFLRLVPLGHILIQDDIFLRTAVYFSFFVAMNSDSHESRRPSIIIINRTMFVSATLKLLNNKFFGSAERSSLRTFFGRPRYDILYLIN
jgi:hypothetical protein